MLWHFLSTLVSIFRKVKANLKKRRLFVLCVFIFVLWYLTSELSSMDYVKQNLVSSKTVDVAENLAF